MSMILNYPDIELNLVFQSFLVLVPQQKFSTLWAKDFNSRSEHVAKDDVPARYCRLRWRQYVLYSNLSLWPPYMTGLREVQCQGLL